MQTPPCSPMRLETGPKLATRFVSPKMLLKRETGQLKVPIYKAFQRHVDKQTARVQAMVMAPRVIRKPLVFPGHVSTNPDLFKVDPPVTTENGATQTPSGNT